MNKAIDIPQPHLQPREHDQNQSPALLRCPASRRDDLVPNVDPIPDMPGNGGKKLLLHTNMSIGCSIGAVVGAYLGTINATLAVVLSPFVIPGTHIVISRPLDAALTGAILGSLFGCLIGALLGWGVSDKKIQEFELELENNLNSHTRHNDDFDDQRYTENWKNQHGKYANI